MKVNQILLIFAVFTSSLFFSACETQDKYLDWKVMNDEWFQARQNEKTAFPFTWTLDDLKTPMLNNGFTTTETGIRYRALRLGNPADRMPNPTSYIWATYEGKLIDGTSFDSGTEAYLGSITGLVPGFQEILEKMHIGDIYEFYLPADLGYGKNGNYQIPAYSVLIFRVELTDAKY
ncbi:MAG: FKBP-type peptidyl-prolyl cis-trans isomerase [Paludibacteraceae bacterium]